MPAVQRALPTTSYVVLALLSFGRELTGYELKQWADGSLRFFYTSPAMSQIYAELERLEAAGLARSRDDSGGADRARRTFRITRKGTSELRRLIGEAPVPATATKHSVALRVFLGHLAEPERLDAMLAAHEARTKVLLAEIAVVRAGLADDETWRYATIVAEWGRATYAAELDATHAAREQLRDVRRSAG